MTVNGRQSWMLRSLKGGAPWRLVAGLLLLLGLAGCATTDESDMPWGTPASWEGSPFIPGLSD